MLQTIQWHQSSLQCAVLQGELYFAAHNEQVGIITLQPQAMRHLSV